MSRRPAVRATALPLMLLHCSGECSPLERVPMRVGGSGLRSRLASPSVPDRSDVPCVAGSRPVEPSGTCGHFLSEMRRRASHGGCSPYC